MFFDAAKTLRFVVMQKNIAGFPDFWTTASQPSGSSSMG
jgi:hypothetical protein